MTQGHARPPRDISEFDDYVQRAEARFAAATDAEVTRLFALYQQLRPRFDRDLGAGSRDAMVSRAAALMLIQYRAGSRDPAGPSG